MTALLVVVLVVGFLLVAVLVYLLGFRLGGQSGISELQRVRAEAAEAERQLHDLTRSAFVAMAEAAERRRFDRS
ncbi:MAG: hypothetical protein M0Z69_08270 [Actinomycetota bacterium]|nr:hypothetical protein [Actinomycetota bacterium]